MTARDTVNALGGALFLARYLGIKRPAIYNWGQIGIIPPRHYLALAELAEEKKVFLDRELFKERVNGKAQGERSGPVERRGAAEP